MKDSNYEKRELMKDEEVKFAITIMGTGKYKKEAIPSDKKSIIKYYQDNYDLILKTLQESAVIEVSSHLSIERLDLDIGQIQEN